MIFRAGSESDPKPIKNLLKTGFCYMLGPGPQRIALHTASRPINGGVPGPPLGTWGGLGQIFEQFRNNIQLKFQQQINPELL